MPIIFSATSPQRLSDQLFALSGAIAHAYRRYKAAPGAEDDVLGLVSSLLQALGECRLRTKPPNAVQELMRRLAALAHEGGLLGADGLQK